MIVENLGTPWIVGKIQLAGDQEVVFEKGVVVLAKRGAFQGKGDSLFTAALKKNVTLTGHGATFRMWKKDYQSDEYEKAEWRHCLSIRSCSHVCIAGLTLAESGGDGIYLGVAKAGVTNSDVWILDVVCDANHRQGISVISAEDLCIEDCVLKNTSGTAPQAGIDFEPNHPSEKLVNCVMRNCVTQNNAGDGYEFYLKNLNGSSDPVSIRIEDCRSVGDARCALRWATRNTHPDGPTKGSAQFTGCTFEKTGQGVVIAENAARACKLRFVDCQIVDTALKTPDASPITFSAGNDNRANVGGVTFTECLVNDPLDRTPMTFLDWSGTRRVVDVTGTLTVERDGHRTDYSLDEKTLTQWMPWTAMADVPRFPTAGVRFEPVSPEPPKAGYRVCPWRQRELAEYVLFAKAGETASFTVRVLPVRDRTKPVPVQVTAPSGKAVEVPDAPSGKETPYSFPAGETGAHKIVCRPESDTVVVGSTTHPLCTYSDEAQTHFFGARGELFFWVPRAVHTFGVKVTGSNVGERVKAALCGASGSVIEEVDNITRPHLFAVDVEERLGDPKDAPPGEVWSLRISRPTEGVLEDFYVQLLGVPPLLSCSPEALLKPAP
ncbi:MAG TPA: right-handed parallel beta-helix repeat-containing protein [Thermoguttaceae bacterium]|nr:right-handed parallel beta-helix repeat-containing protein [Thermoguttaceae bacterium]